MSTPGAPAGPPSRTAAMFVPINAKASVRELIQGIIVQSGNDAAIAVAEGIAGSEAAFAQRMTARARKIGMEKSVFKNATGLYDPQHLMTAREIALLARYLINDFPEYYGMFAQREFRYRKHRFFNRNPLLLTEIGVDGLKTGYVKDARATASSHLPSRAISALSPWQWDCRVRPRANRRDESCWTGASATSAWRSFFRRE